MDAAAAPTESCTRAADDPCKDSTDNVISSFDWIQTYAGEELGKLQAELTKADKPDWTLELIKSVLDFSLEKGVGLVAEHIAGRLIDAGKEGAAEAREVIKSAFEGGVKKGTKKAEDVLKDEPSPEPAEFIRAQVVAVADLYKQAQTQFVHTGRHVIRTAREAASIEAAFDATHLKEAAKNHHDASRDAYLSCLARKTMGETREGTTNMAPQEQRSDDSRAVHRWSLTWS